MSGRMLDTEPCRRTEEVAEELKKVKTTSWWLKALALVITLSAVLFGLSLLS